MILWNLQQFADDKTEKATPRKRQEVRNKGQVVKSHDLTSAIGLLLALCALKLIGSTIFTHMQSWTQQGLTINEKTDMTPIGMHHIFIQWLLNFAVVVVPILAILFIGSLVVSIVQVKGMFRIQSLLPDFKRINPISGMKRFFSLRSSEELLKACLKVAVVGLITYLSLQNDLTYIHEWTNISPIMLVSVIGNDTFQIGIKIAIVLLILGIFDYFYQKYEFEKSIKMSKQEIKEEFKQTEGNPVIKQKIRERQRAMAMRRMMADVPKADVVITNPTHFAVAIQYQSGMNAPKVVAKGIDSIALKIREIARTADVPIVENRPLARALYHTVEIDEEIPADMFQAVAEVLAYVYKLKKIV